MIINGFELGEEMVASLRERPLAVVDVGAAGGVAPHYAHDLIRVIGFEPDPDSFKEAAAQLPANVTLLNEALWSCSAKKDLFLTKSRRCSSMYPPNPSVMREFDLDRFSVEQIVTLTCRSLRDVLYDAGLQDVDFIKIDTQGSELDIFTGSIDILRDYVVGMDVEAEFLELYQGQPLFTDVHGFLSDLSFRLARLKPANYPPHRGRDYQTPEQQKTRAGYVGFVDARYWKPAAAIGEMTARFGEQAGRSKLFRTLLSLIVHGHPELIGPLLSVAGIKPANAPLKLAR